MICKFMFTAFHDQEQFLVLGLITLVAWCKAVGIQTEFHGILGLLTQLTGLPHAQFCILNSDIFIAAPPPSIFVHDQHWVYFHYKSPKIIFRFINTHIYLNCLNKFMVWMMSFNPTQNMVCTFRCVCKIAEGNYELCHVCLSVCLHGTNRLPLDGFFKKFDIWAFFKNLLRKFKFH
jgi:hypothetical protein